MNQLASPLISRTEAIHDLPDKLTELGYASVFDVVLVCQGGSV
nr:Tc toxin subunit A [Photorhabdus stackebrandtii]